MDMFTYSRREKYRKAIRDTHAALGINIEQRMQHDLYVTGARRAPSVAPSVRDMRVPVPVNFERRPRADLHLRGAKQAALFPRHNTLGISEICKKKVPMTVQIHQDKCEHSFVVHSNVLSRKNFSSKIDNKHLQKCKKVTFSDHVTVDFIPSARELPKDLMWWTAAEMKSFIRAFAAALPPGCNQKQSLCALGRLVRDYESAIDFDSMKCKAENKYISNVPAHFGIVKDPNASCLY